MSVFALTYTDNELLILGKSYGNQSAAATPLPSGLVRRGRINDPQQFSQAILQSLQNATPKSIKATSVIIGLPEQHAFIKTIEVPANLKGKELDSVLAYQWKDILPVQPDQVYYTYSPMSAKSADPQKKQIFLMAYPRDIIDSLFMALGLINITPQRLLPMSFGYTDLFAADHDTSTLIITTDNGEDVMAIAGSAKSTYFSTSIHTQIANPMSTRQINNMRTFYDRTIGKTTSPIKSLVLFKNEFTDAITNQLAPLQLTTKVISPESYLKLRQPYPSATIERFVALYGLLHSQTFFSIQPDDMKTTIAANKQHYVLRTMFGYITATLAIVFYFSLVFLGGLRLNTTTKTRFSQNIIERATTQAQQNASEITSLNSLITKIDESQKQGSLLGSDIEIITKLQTSEILLHQIVYDKTTKTITLTGSRQSLAAITSFIENLKQVPRFSKATFETSPATLVSQGAGSFAISITGEGL